MLELISLRYMIKFKRGGYDAPLNSVHFMDGEFCPVSDINAVTRPVVSSATLPSPNSSPSASQSVNGTTTTNCCTESSNSVSYSDVYHSTR